MFSNDAGAREEIMTNIAMLIIDSMRVNPITDNFMATILGSGVYY
jgi:hypothetical protein